MADLIERLKAALDEDEQIALACIAINGQGLRGWGSWTHQPDGRVQDDQDVLRVRFTWSAEAAHITRHDPARVLGQVAAHRKILAWHPVETRILDGVTEYTCPCQWDYNYEEFHWHPQVSCDLTAAIASVYELDVPKCTCKDCTPISQWKERGYA